MDSKREAQWLAAEASGDRDLLETMRLTDDRTRWRQQVVHRTAMESSRRGNGRFIEAGWTHVATRELTPAEVLIRALDESIETMGRVFSIGD